jgi:hypothetical protein
MDCLKLIYYLLRKGVCKIIKIIHYGILSLFIISLSHVSEEVRAQESKAGESDIPEFFVPPPPFSEGIYPCSQCHEGMKANPLRRELTFHTEIAEGFNHDKEHRWCLDCHNTDNRDVLRSVGGKPITFEESYYLCGQCHGTIFRDWKAGVHGKRTGSWNGEKQYRLCVHCHIPHWPRFKPIEPMPPPDKPEDIQYRKLPPDQIPLNPLGDIQ